MNIFESIKRIYYSPNDISDMVNQIYILNFMLFKQKYTKFFFNSRGVFFLQRVTFYLHTSVPSSFQIKFRIHTRGLSGQLGEDRHLPRAGECDRPLFYYLPCQWFRLYAYFLLPWLFLYFIFIEFGRLINKPSLLLFRQNGRIFRFIPNQFW